MFNKEINQRRVEQTPRAMTFLKDSLSGEIRHVISGLFEQPLFRQTNVRSDGDYATK